MHNFDYSKVWKQTLTLDVVSLLTALHEYRGRQVMFDGSKAEALAQLVASATLQSVKTSNKTEGVFVTEDRLKKLVNEKTRPRDAGEQESAGYRDVFSLIGREYGYLPFKPNIILQLHQNLYKYSGGAASGRFKPAEDTAAAEAGGLIGEAKPDGARTALQAVEDLCSAYENILNDGKADPLIIIPMAVCDFICISPFDEGNGRMARLLTLLLLNRAGYFAGKYVSIDKLIAQSEEAYFEALKQSSCGWEENANDYLPFIIYTLGVVSEAYKELFERTELLTRKGVSKPDRVAAFIKNASGKITKTEILKQCPDVSGITVQRTLAELLKDGKIIKIGGGRYTQYVWSGEEV